MGDLLNFNNGNEEESEVCCPTCEMVLDFMDVLHELQPETPEEMFDLLSSFANSAKLLGIREHLALRIESDMQLLDHLEFGCDCGECEN